MDVTSPDMRCSFQGQIRPATSTFEVEAGREVGWGLDHVIFHPGPAAVYLGRPEGGEVKLQDWDGSGKAWFKVRCALLGLLQLVYMMCRALISIF